jgi:hypothetical protein
MVYDRKFTEAEEAAYEQVMKVVRPSVRFILDLPRGGRDFITVNLCKPGIEAR